MQREFRKKIVTYGFAAVLLAVLLTAVCYHFGVQPVTQLFPELKTFSSYEEIERFLKRNMEIMKNLKGRLAFFSDSGLEAVPSSPDVKAAPAHSTTNIQVAGVDEADIVKVDDEGFLYVFSGDALYVVQAYPPEKLKVLSKIVFETYSAEIYVNNDRLTVLGHSYNLLLERMPYRPNVETTFINIYDVSDRAAPKLTRRVILNGTLLGSRMIGNYVYAVVTQPATLPSEKETGFEVVLPKIVVNNSFTQVKPTDIHYVNVSDVSYFFTTIIAVNIVDDAEPPTYESILEGATSCVYVSTSNMYLAVPNTNLWILTADESVPKYETLIYRVNLNNEKIVWEAQGAVPGYVLNQFSMDEYNGYFRIATTIGWGENSVNNLFILDANLKIVGNLTGLDPGKQIYAARFMGDRCYLVTFYQKDPFFAIDVGNPFKPKVLGALEIEGFSGYLHPYDENHIIGVGMEGSSVKLSLYDVENVKNPKEIDKYLIGNFSYTLVLGDHKAFLFDKKKSLLAFPVSISIFQPVKVERDVFGEKYSRLEGFWQGAYIFNVSLKGFTLKGNVTHNDQTWSDGILEVKRILYIENVLYTVSSGKVKLNSLEDLSLIGEIKLS
ncbi:MAG: beta-propeller domain-containing protein [Candidatus Bathyarchaeia archaeon]